MDEQQMGNRPFLERIIAQAGIQPRRAVFDEQERLRTLDLSGLRLSRVPDGLGQLRYLQVLNLVGNQLAAIPGELGQLSELMQARAVSKLVNNPRNEGAAILA